MEQEPIPENKKRLNISDFTGTELSTITELIRKGKSGEVNEIMRKKIHEHTQEKKEQVDNSISLS